MKIMCDDIDKNHTDLVHNVKLSLNSLVACSDIDVAITQSSTEAAPGWKRGTFF